MNESEISILIADDHEMVLEGLTSGLNTFPDLKVAGTARSTTDAVHQAKLLRPRVVLLDICMPGDGVFESAREIQSLGIGAKLILTSGFMADVFISQVLKLRMSGYILKGDSLQFLADAIRKVTGGETVFSRQIEERVVFDSQQHRFVARYESDLAMLTGRQLEVLRHLASGQSVKEIAKLMHLSQKSVDSHKYRIMNKLGIHDRVELSRFAIREGLMVP
ncbi:response regulator [bacterium]|nr:response regulator [bacterium]